MELDFTGSTKRKTCMYIERETETATEKEFFHERAMVGHVHKKCANVVAVLCLVHTLMHELHMMYLYMFMTTLE